MVEVAGVSLLPGLHIEVKYEESWYPGTLEEEAADRTWTVKYDDGSRQSGVFSARVRLPTKGEHTARDTHSTEQASSEPKGTPAWASRHNHHPNMESYGIKTNEVDQYGSPRKIPRWAFFWRDNLTLDQLKEKVLESGYRGFLISDSSLVRLYQDRAALNFSKCRRDEARPQGDGFISDKRGDTSTLFIYYPDGIGNNPPNIDYTLPITSRNPASLRITNNGEGVVEERDHSGEIPVDALAGTWWCFGCANSALFPCPFFQGYSVTSGEPVRLLGQKEDSDTMIRSNGCLCFQWFKRQQWARVPGSNSFVEARYPPYSTAYSPANIYINQCCMIYCTCRVQGVALKVPGCLGVGCGSGPACCRVEH